MNQGSGFWTAARTEQLKSLLAEGKTASQAATAIKGTSRNAVISKAHRKGFQMNAPNDGGIRAKTGGVQPKPKSRDFDMNRAISKPKAAPKPQPVQRPSHAAPSLNLTLLELNANDCHFIEGDDNRYCGHPTEEFQAYCPAHCKIVWQPVRARAA